MRPPSARIGQQLGLVVYALVAHGAAHAAGPADAEVGARALGRAGAVVASADDLSALEYNPAALKSPAGGWTVMSGVTFVSRGATFQPLGATQIERNQAAADTLPFAALALGLGQRVVVAAGAYQSIGA
ncbi:MAG TPA: hypothetical protein VKN99_26430, partial [Polyangia bacterium]|nr:hypothetical protein [Polyangia bacterium]